MQLRSGLLPISEVVFSNVNSMRDFQSLTLRALSLKTRFLSSLLKSSRVLVLISSPAAGYENGGLPGRKEEGKEMCQKRGARGRDGVL